MIDFISNKDNFIDAVIVYIQMVGSFSEFERKVESLEDAYFYTVEKIENKEEISINYKM